MIFLQGSPVLEEKRNQVWSIIRIVAHFIPKYLQKNRMPSWETNCIEDWETKIDAIVEETFDENMTIISGIPSWVQMYFERLQQKVKPWAKYLQTLISLFMEGYFEPYRAKFENLIGRKVDSIELFPASEDFCLSDSQKEKECCCC
jgi:hypothetical protein